MHDLLRSNAKFIRNDRRLNRLVYRLYRSNAFYMYLITNVIVSIKLYQIVYICIKMDKINKNRDIKCELRLVTIVIIIPTM